MILIIRIRKEIKTRNIPVIINLKKNIEKKKEVEIKKGKEKEIKKKIIILIMAIPGDLTIEIVIENVIEIVIDIGIEKEIEIIVGVINIQNIKSQNQDIVVLQGISKEATQVLLPIQIQIHLIILNLHQNQILIQVRKSKILQKIKIFHKI